MKRSLKVQPLPRSKAHTVSGDAAQVRALLAWARETGVDMQSVSVGNCSVQLRQSAAPQGERAAARDPRTAMYEQFGGAMYRHLTGAAPDTGVRGEEYEPALGVEPQ